MACEFEGSELPSRADFVIIGGGIVGVTVALQVLRQHPKASLVLIEKEADIAVHASGRNSGVLHAGFYYTTDSLKAKFTVDGNKFLTEYIKERGLPLNECGKVVVAQHEDDLAGLDLLLERGRANGCTLESVTAKEVLEIDPLVRTHERAIWSPLTSASDPAAVTKSLAQDAVDLGAKVVTGVKCEQIVNPGRGGAPSTLKTTAGRIEAGHVINCGGLFADRLAHSFGFGEGLRVLPFKGLYLYVDVPLKTLVYPVPDLSAPFLGVHFTVTVDGKVKIGPTAIPAFWRENYQGLDNFSPFEFAQVMATEARLFLGAASFDFRKLALHEIRKYERSYMAEGAGNLLHGGLEEDRLLSYGAPGIRAQLVDTREGSLLMDFCVQGDESSTHVLNAVSPAWTCSMPFAEHVVKSIPGL